MPPLGFEPTNPLSERQQTNALDRAATAAFGVNTLLRYQTVSLPVAEPVRTHF